MDFPFRCFCIRSVAAASLSQQNEDQECGDQNHGDNDHEIDIPGQGRQKIALREKSRGQGSKRMVHDLNLFS